jgi:hypothetical protein
MNHFAQYRRCASCRVTLFLGNDHVQAEIVSSGITTKLYFHPQCTKNYFRAEQASAQTDEKQMRLVNQEDGA